MSASGKSCEIFCLCGRVPAAPSSNVLKGLLKPNHDIQVGAAQAPLRTRKASGKRTFKSVPLIQAMLRSV
jgi:hypothetical protein